MSPPPQFVFLTFKKKEEFLITRKNSSISYRREKMFWILNSPTQPLCDCGDNELFEKDKRRRISINENCSVQSCSVSAGIDLSPCQRMVQTHEAASLTLKGGIKKNGKFNIPPKYCHFFPSFFKAERWTEVIRNGRHLSRPINCITCSFFFLSFFLQFVPEIKKSLIQFSYFF